VKLTNRQQDKARQTNVA